MGFLRNNSALLPPAEDLKRAVTIVNEAKKVTILARAGCEGSHAELLKIAERLQVPIVHAFRGKEFVEYDNPYDVGMTRLIGFSSGYHAMMECDALPALGTDFPYPQFYPAKARKIQVDVRGEQIGRRTNVDVGLIGAVRETIDALVTRIGSEKDSAHLEDSILHYQARRKDLDKLAVGKPGHLAAASGVRHQGT